MTLTAGAAFLAREDHQRVPGPLLGLELPWPGLIGIGHAERELVAAEP